MSLGRGLGALIAPTNKERKRKEYATGAPNDGATKIWNLPISELEGSAKQPRQNFDPTALNELAESIKKHGILQPLLVAEKRDGGYEIIAGERRWRAAKIAGLATVPAVVKQLPEREKLEVALIENIQREDLDPLEEAFAYKRLIEEFGLSHQEVGEKVGKSRPAISNTIRLLELPEEIKKALIDKKINYGQARALLSLKNEKEQLDALASMMGKKITVRELEKTVAKMRPPEMNRRDPNLAFLEEKMRAALGTKVSVSQKGERGTISISYYSKEELARLVENIVND